MDSSLPSEAGSPIESPDSYAEDKAALVATEDKFRSLAEEMPMIAWTATPAGQIDFVNRMLSDYTGLALDQPSAASWQDSIHPDDLDRCLVEWGHSISTSTSFEIEYRIRRRDGQYRWFRVQVVPTGSKDGTPGKWYGTAIDIHETKTLQEIATRSAESLTTTLESITDAFMTLDKDWRFTYINAEAEKLLGRPRSELIGQNMWSEFPLGAESFGREYHRAVNDDVVVAVEVYFEAMDAWLDVHAYPTREGLVTHLRNITDQKRASLKLQEQTEQLLNAQRIGRMGTWDLDILTGQLVWSAATCNLFGVTPVAFAGTFEHFLTFVLPEYRAALINDVERSKADLSPLESEYRILRPDGQIRWIYQRATIDGDTTRRLGMVMDVTDRHQAARELRNAYEELESRVESRTADLALANGELKEARDSAEAANRAKTEFLSGMSHELRTPMNAILGFGQLLELSNLDPHRKECVGHILKAGRHLLSLINDVLEISRVEIGELALSLESVNVAEVLRDGCSLMRTIAGDHTVTLIQTPFPETFVKADRQKLRQVVLNLLSNGIKYNKPCGSITITVEEKADDDVLILFTDTGIGVAEDCMDKLFKPFERLGACKETEGAGLGLALSRSLSEAMGGSLTATSVENEGSCFTICLKRSLEPSAAATAPPWFDLIPAYSGLEAHILVIKDNLANIALYEQIFAPHPEIHLSVAALGRLGLELGKAQRPDLILLDLHLPDISGKEVLLALKREPDLAAVPVIVVSADAFLDRSADLLAAGAFRYLTKPVDLFELSGAVQEALKFKQNN